MILIYVAGPFSALTRAGVEKNIERAVAQGRELAARGFFPIIPHANTAHPEFEKAQDYKFWVGGYLKLLTVCRAVKMVPGWEGSGGATAEKKEAERMGLEVFETFESLENWAVSNAQRDGRFRRELYENVSHIPEFLRIFTR